MGIHTPTTPRLERQRTGERGIDAEVDPAPAPALDHDAAPSRALVRSLWMAVITGARPHRDVVDRR